jgi:hypothetical protein
LIEIKYNSKSQFWFGDVNGCLILKKIYRLKIKHEQRRDFITIKKYRKAYIIEAFENFTEDTDFITDLNINSANLVDIILDVEVFLKSISIMSRWKK